jgi:hypothetical protein
VAQLLRFRQIGLAATQLIFGLLALGQVEDESDALVPAFFEIRRTHQRGHTAAVFPEILRFIRL